MNKTIMILKHEIVTLTSRFSFWFGVFGLPLIGFLAYAGVSAVNRSQGGDNASPINNVQQAFTEQEDTRPMGYVDQGGLIRLIPNGFPRQNWIDYPSQQAAMAALDHGDISEFYVIPADYVSKGEIMVYMPDFKLISNQTRTDELQSLLTYNLLGGDTQLAAAVRNPIVNLNTVSLAPPEAGPQRDTNNMWTFMIPYAVMMLFYVGILGSAGLLLNSVAKEKENRIMEVLLLSATPRQILMGKVIGLGLVGLLQVVVWIISALSLLTLSGQTFSLPSSAVLPPSMLGWGVLFFVLGYMVYASLMAGMGALVPNLREASQATIIVVIPLMIPLFLISALIEDPNSTLAVVLSLFPLTAPTTMMLRLSAVNVPLWQPILAAALLVVTALFVVRAVANMFRAQNILSGQPFNIKRFFLALAGR